MKTSPITKGEYLTSGESNFVDRMMTDLQVDQNGIRRKTALRKDHIEKIAAGFGITDKTEVKELTEFAVVKLCRGITSSSKDSEEAFSRLKEFYHSQPNLSHRSSLSTIYQQYSTPSPIAYLAGLYCKFEKENSSVLEPSAGNGLLTIAFESEQVIVNEIDKFRRKILSQQGFKEVLSFDASQIENFRTFYRKFDAVVSNPPFDKLKFECVFEDTEFGVLDHLMAVLSLTCMKDDGRAAIIVGGHTEYDEKGRIKAGKNRKFISYLYSRFFVDDIININGDLYSKQGTSFDIRLILIRGRKPFPEGFPPLLNEMDPNSRGVVNDFDTLFHRVTAFLNPAKSSEPVSISKISSKSIINQEFDLQGKLKAFAYQFLREELLENFKRYIAKGRFWVESDGVKSDKGAYYAVLKKDVSTPSRDDYKIIGGTWVYPQNPKDELSTTQIQELALPLISDSVHQEMVERAIRDKNFIRDISAKSMTALDAKTIIESAGLEVPSGILSKIKSEKKSTYQLLELEAAAIMIELELLEF